MTYSRWRRRYAGYGDIQSLVTDLGGDATVVAFYDRRTGTAVSATDHRGALGGPALTVSGGVTFDPLTGWALNGTTGYLRSASAGRLAELTGDFGMFAVFIRPTTAGTPQVISCIGGAGGFALAQDTTAATIKANAAGGIASPSTPNLTGGIVRVGHARHVGSGAATMGVQMGSVAEVTTAGVFTLFAGGVTQLTVGADGAGTPGNYGNMTLAALGVIKGNYATLNVAALVNAWAAANHGAVL